MNFKRQPFILWLALFTALIGVTWSTIERIKIEKASRQIELVLDYDSLIGLAAKEGISLTAALDRVKESGITAIGLPEMTLERLRLNGKVVWFSGEELIRFGNLSDTIHSTVSYLKKSGKILQQHIYVWSDDLLLLNLIKLRFGLFLGKNRVLEHRSPDLLKKPGEVYNDRILEIIGDAEELKDFGLGIYESEYKSLESKGFHIVPRFENKDGLDRAELSYLLYERKPISSVSAVIFSGIRNEVLGYKHLITDTAELFRSRQYNFGIVEVYDSGKMQKGAQTLARLLPDQTVRVQTIPSQQMTKINIARALDMWKLGVRERNIRVLYLRPFLMTPDDAVLKQDERKSLMDINMEYFQSLSNSLKQNGFSIGKPVPFSLFYFSPVLTILALCGVWGVVCLFLGFYNIRFNIVVHVLSLSFLALGTLAAIKFGGVWGIWSKGWALFASLLFPVFGNILGWRWLRKLNVIKIRHIIAAAFIMTAVTILGGLVLGTILRGNIYLLGADQMRGIKLLLVVPPVLAALLIYLESKKENGDWFLCIKKFKELLHYKVSLWQLLLVGSLAGLILLLLVRSGNVGEELVPEWERTLRNVIEQFLIVRPRFKEFLIGYPALFLGGYLLQCKKVELLPFVAFFAAIGQANCLDSFAHLHTPLWAVFLRTFHAFWIGIIISGFVWGMGLVFRKHEQNST